MRSDYEIIGIMKKGRSVVRLITLYSENQADFSQVLSDFLAQVKRELNFDADVFRKINIEKLKNP